MNKPTYFKSQSPYQGSNADDADEVHERIQGVRAPFD